MNSLTIKCLVLAVTTVVPVVCQQYLLFWCYECRQGECKRVAFRNPELQHPLSLSVCRLTCGVRLGTLWPQPSRSAEFTGVVPISRNIRFLMPLKSNVAKLWDASRIRFEGQLSAKVPDYTVASDFGRLLIIRVLFPSEASLDLTYDTNESYRITMNTTATETNAFIEAYNYFGARHGLETLSQLIVFDEINHTFVTLANAIIQDQPMYKHRGLMLDTASNYFSRRSIERTIDAMAMVKLNRLHWHIVDSSSFPLLIKSQPDLSFIGAYSPWKIYTHEDVVDLVEYARIRGVRIYPELDFPAHTGEGWQLKTCALCVHNRFDTCRPPPWGQLDPSNDETYAILDDIYREVFEIFNPDMFHMGGSQVTPEVWIESKALEKWQETHGLQYEDAPNLEDEAMNLWTIFHRTALLKVENASNYQNAPTILWTTALPMLPNIDDLDKSRIVLQVADAKQDLKKFLNLGHKVIVSSVDQLFFGCDFTYRSSRLAHCSPSIDWRAVYENRFDDVPEDHHQQILGAEAVLFSKFTDEMTVDARFWPRSSALAERLWSNPSTDSWRSAAARMLLHRQRLRENGIAAEAVQPEWCLQNQDKCDHL